MVLGGSEMKITKAPEIKSLKPQEKQINHSCGGGLQVVVEPKEKKKEDTIYLFNNYIFLCC